MAVETQTGTEEEELAERARAAVAEAARQLTLVTPVPDAGEEGREEPTGDALASLRALAYLGRAVEECAALAARAAAPEGAGDPPRGGAGGVSPPGARQPWPRLVV
ncbi:response regulator, partial [Streptomyces sp. NPDC058193]